MEKLIKSEKGAIAALVVVTVLMFVLILMGTYMAITNLRKSQLESDIRIQQVYGGDVEKVYEEISSNLREVPIEELKAGDYIKYNSGENGMIMCRVLYPADSEYGLQIITDKNVKNVTLGGRDWETVKESYNNAIKILNEEAEKYINEKYASDARCVGTIPTIDENRKFINKNNVTQTTVKLPASYTKPSGWTSNDTGLFDTDTNYKTDLQQLYATSLCRTGEYYWFGAHYTYEEAGQYTFYVRYVDPNGTVPSSIICIINKDGTIDPWERTDTGIRPCILLKKEITTVRGGDGSEESPYMIL